MWLSAIRDAFSRRVVAWEISARADADLVLTLLEYALASREVTSGELVHHADHGWQYTSVKLTASGGFVVVGDRVVFGAGEGVVGGWGASMVPFLRGRTCDPSVEWSGSGRPARMVFGWRG